MTTATRPPIKRVGKAALGLGAGLGTVVLVLMTAVGFFSWRTEATIEGHRQVLRGVADANPSPVHDPMARSDLPDPVRRYFDFAFVENPEPMAVVEMTMEGDFRRPLTEGFSPTSANQVVAIGTPALVFSARTYPFPGLWAQAYDAYTEGNMEMKAKILSAITVVDESETPELNRTSIRRWLLESPLYPAALLPGGPVRWEPIDDSRARAIVSADGLEASLVASFRPDGSLASFEAEEDGDLSTPYHGSGEHVSRTDYREVDGVMIPHGFTIARAADGELFPFWSGEITAISFQRS